MPKARPRGAAKTAHEAVAEIALQFPGAEQRVSHGMPCFCVRGGKGFATLAVNHHGDDRLALWLKAAPGAQQQLAAAKSPHYFVPAYVGTSGWLGVRLDRRLSWNVIADHLRSAYEQVAPAALRAQLTATPRIEPPTAGLSVEEVDPMRSAEAMRAVASMREICLALPDTSEGTQFGKPVWRVGKRVFAQCWRYEGPVCAAFWVGVEAQGLMTTDPRYSIPAYVGHNGWIALDVTRVLRKPELRSLALQSHAHFAPARRAPRN